MRRQPDYLSMHWLELDGRSVDVVELLLGAGHSMRAEGGGQWSCLFEWCSRAMSSGQRHDAVADWKKEMVARAIAMGNDPTCGRRQRRCCHGQVPGQTSILMQRYPPPPREEAMALSS